MTQSGGEGEDGDSPLPRGTARLFKVSTGHMCYLGGRGWDIKLKTESSSLVSSQGYTLWFLDPQSIAGAVHSCLAFWHLQGTRL